MTTKLGQHFRIVLFVLLSFLYGYLVAAKSLKVQLIDIKCKHNPNYAANSSCKLSQAAPSVGANFYMQMKSVIKDFRLDLIFYLIRKKVQYLLFKAPDVDVCEEFHKNITAVYLQLFKEMTLRAGKWPKCPVPANFYYKFENLTPNLDYVPNFVPDVPFKMDLIMKDRKQMFMELSVLGKVVNRKSLKSTRPH